MLKQPSIKRKPERKNQPPSGGCVLKRLRHCMKLAVIGPAAFGRLCVETTNFFYAPLQIPPAAFGRLCVETVGRGRLT